MEKLDLKKARRQLFTARPGRFIEIDVPSCQYLMKGELKRAGKDFVVAPLEGLWSSPDPSSFKDRRKSEWDWTMMIMVPDHVEQGHFDTARERARQKLGEALSDLRIASCQEGRCLQALHIAATMTKHRFSPISIKISCPRRATPSQARITKFT
jgi:hypothetical protein